MSPQDQKAGLLSTGESEGRHRVLEPRQGVGHRPVLLYCFRVDKVEYCKRSTEIPAISKPGGINLN